MTYILFVILGLYARSDLQGQCSFLFFRINKSVSSFEQDITSCESMCDEAAVYITAVPAVGSDSQ